MTRIATTHVGSLPRSKRALDFLFARDRGEPYDAEEFAACMAEECAETVRKQVEAGVDIVSDGETSKISYTTYVKNRYTGFSGNSARAVPGDLKLFPRYLERLASQGGTPKLVRPQCTGPVAPKGDADLRADIANMKNAMAAHGAERGFLNAASPGVVALFMPNAYYPSREAYMEALADALKAEYDAILAAGFDLQLDCPDLGLARHVLYEDRTDAEFGEIAKANVEVLNHALRDADPARVRIHICWGNYEGPHVCDVGLDHVFSALMSARARYVLFENANPRHEHEWTVFRDRLAEIPGETILVPGVIDTTSNFVEHPELIAQRIGRFVDIFGPERVIAGTDCGFGTFAGFGSVDPDIVYVKLAALAEGAAIASGRI